MKITLRRPVSVSHSASTLSSDGEFSRLMTAAVVNRNFCNLLLTNPAMALAAGFGGESFRLTTEEQELILSIRATSLSNFAMQLTKSQNGNGHRNGNGVGKKVWGFK